MDKNMSIFNARPFSDSFFRNFFEGPHFPTNSMSAALDMYEDDDTVVVKFSVPGFKKDDFHISVEDDVLTVSGEIESEKEEEDKKKKYYYKEMSKQAFTRSVRLPVRVKSEVANAEYKDGVLNISLPKAEEVKPRKIDIKTS